MIRKFLVASAVAVCVLGIALPARASGVLSVDPASLNSGGYGCAQTGSPIIGYSADQLQARVTQPGNPVHYNYTFDIWPTNSPATVTSIAATTFDASQYANGNLLYSQLQNSAAYSWHAQVSDGVSTSAWSPTCHFTYDSAPPSQPTVTSSNFPPNRSGPARQAAKFTFDGNGDADVAAFQYSWNSVLSAPSCTSGNGGYLDCPDPIVQLGAVRADHPGGSAQVSLTPPSTGFLTLSVRSLDAAGNFSATVTYRILVPSTGPLVSVEGSGPLCGPSVQVTFRPGPAVHDVISYSWTAGGASGTVAADGSGRATLTFPLNGFLVVTVTSTSADGFVSDQGGTYLSHADPLYIYSPTYPADGTAHGATNTPGTFFFTPSWTSTSVTQVRYHFGTLSRTVPVDFDSGFASAVLVPTHDGSHTVTATGLTAAGRPATCPGQYTFVVADRGH